MFSERHVSTHTYSITYFFYIIVSKLKFKGKYGTMLMNQMSNPDMQVNFSRQYLCVCVCVISVMTQFHTLLVVNTCENCTLLQYLLQIEA